MQLKLSNYIMNSGNFVPVKNIDNQRGKTSLTIKDMKQAVILHVY